MKNVNKNSLKVNKKLLTLMDKEIKTEIKKYKKINNKTKETEKLPISDEKRKDNSKEKDKKENKIGIKKICNFINLLNMGYINKDNTNITLFENVFDITNNVESDNSNEISGNKKDKKKKKKLRNKMRNIIESKNINVQNQNIQNNNNKFKSNIDNKKKKEAIIYDPHRIDFGNDILDNNDSINKDTENNKDDNNKSMRNIRKFVVYSKRKIDDLDKQKLKSNNSNAISEKKINKFEKIIPENPDNFKIIDDANKKNIKEIGKESDSYPKNNSPKDNAKKSHNLNNKRDMPERKKDDGNRKKLNNSSDEDINYRIIKLNNSSNEDISYNRIKTNINPSNENTNYNPIKNHNNSNKGNINFNGIKKNNNNNNLKFIDEEDIKLKDFHNKNILKKDNKIIIEINGDNVDSNIDNKKNKLNSTFTNTPNNRKTDECIKYTKTKEYDFTIRSTDNSPKNKKKKKVGKKSGGNKKISADKKKKKNKFVIDLRELIKSDVKEKSKLNPSERYKNLDIKKQDEKIIFNINKNYY